MFQTKEQDKSPETNLNEIEISDLLVQRVQNNGHKYTHQVRRTMHEQSENFNKEKIFKSTKQKS